MQNVIWAYIDRKRKMPVTTLLRTLGFGETDEIIRLFNLAKGVSTGKHHHFQRAIGGRLAFDVVKPVTPVRELDSETGEFRGGYIEQETGRTIEIKTQEADDYVEILDKQTGELIEGLDKETGDPVEYINESTGEVVEERVINRLLLPAEHVITEDDWEILNEYGVGAGLRAA